MARPVTDEAPSQDTYLNLANCEETYEQAFSQRLGTSLLTCGNSGIGAPVYPLSGIVQSLFKLGQLGPTYFRYAKCSDGSLWRISGLAPGQWTKISSSLSGNPCSFASFSNTDYTSQVTAFVADSNGFFKDNGTLAAPQQGGVFPPQFPAQAQAQAPDVIPLDPAVGNVYTTSGVGSFGTGNVTTGNTNAAITQTGIQTVPVTFLSLIRPFEYAVVDTGANQESVLVLSINAGGFVANFTKTHLTGVTVQMFGWSGTVAAGATGIVSTAFPGLPIAAWPMVLNQADYIGLQLFVNDPTQIQQIIIKFDCGDGSFGTDYFYKVIAQGPLQELLNTAQQPTTASTDAILSAALGVYGNDASGIAGLNGAGWTPFLFQLSDFAGAGNADFNDPVFNWENVNGFQVTIVNNGTSQVLIEQGSLVLFGGAGPDTLGGVAYDYVWTFLNPVDGTESNPSSLMTNQNPPNQTYWVYPRRQPVLLTMNLMTYGPLGQLQDGQIGYIRIYRRGGTLGDKFRRVDQIAVTIASGGMVTYLDTTPDYQLAGGQFVSFTNDVPVPSLLPTPVNTTLQAAIDSVNQVVTITPVSMANISVRQQVTLGNPTAIANNFETVVVLTVGGSSFTAFVQNTHTVGEAVQASIKVGQPCPYMVQAFNMFWFWGDPNNPSTLYFSTANAPQYVGEANNVIVSTPDDYITAVAPFGGNILVSTVKSGWWMIPPNNPTQNPPYPTKAKHGCVAPFGYVATEEFIVYQSADGIRVFSGGASEYITQIIEFIWQGVGDTPIVEANQSLLSQTVMAYWNNQIFISYVGLDGNRHRVIYHTVYKRWRNDDFDCQSIFLETDTNLLVVGDSNGLVHLDRQPIPYDQVSTGGVVAKGPIPINLQTAYSFSNAPANQKQYNTPQFDVLTNGQNLAVTLLFDDGEISVPIGNLNNTQRGKINLPLQGGSGQKAYKISLQITGNVTDWVYIYQADIEALTLPRTRRTFDTYDLNLGGTDSKFARDAFIQYLASAPITVNVYYDDNSTPGFTFVLPTANGIRNPLRQRLPAISFRTIRLTGSSTGDFYFWQDSCLWYKFQCQGRGYEKGLFVED